MPNFTSNYNLEQPLGSEFYNVAVNNSNMGKIDTAIKNVSDAVANLDVTNIENGLIDFQYQEPVIVGTQLQITKRSSGQRLFLKINNTLNGNITVSTNGGTSSKPLANFDGVQLTSIPKGFAEVVESGSFFTLRSGGISAADLQALIDIANEAERNESDLKTQFANAVNDLDTDGGINLPTNATWAEILAQIPNIKTGRKWASGDAVIYNQSELSLSVNGLNFEPSVIIMKKNNTVIIETALYVSTSKNSNFIGSDISIFSRSVSQVNSMVTNVEFGRFTCKAANLIENNWSWIAFE